MGKKELAEKVVAAIGISKAKATDAIDLVFAEIKRQTGKGNRVEIRGFGSFSGKTYPGKKGRNPQTGEPITIPPHKTIRFRCSRTIR